MRWPSDRGKGDVPARRRGLFGAVSVVLLLLLVSCTHPGPPDAVDPVPLTDAAELTVTQRYEVVGVETYDRVRVGTMGTLIIPNGASLVSTTVVLEGASRLEMTGGSLLLRGHGGFPPSLSGSCQHIDLSKGSTIRVWGGNGTADHEDATMGASASVDIVSMTYITISDSTVEVLGGHGLSPDAPLTSEGLVGEECSGGDAAIALVAKDLDNAVSIRSSVIRVQAGGGGAAPHGLPQAGSGGQRGGGYSMGGSMGGHVGEGGSTSFSLSAMTVFVDTSTITLSGGDGGDAGAGGKVPYGSETGGGGGGYSGGSGSAGIASAKAGGRVRGDVGSGGDVTYRVTGDDYVQTSTRIDLHAGNGGDAGKGGGSSGDGGGGGGGYSGGGGGSEVEPRGAAGSLVGGRVASGGDVQAILLLDDDVRMVEATLDMRAGDGGRAGEGGLSTGDAGGGGGGYSAGGGAGSVSEAGITGKSMYGGPGSPVEDQVASGGDAVLRINSSTGYLQWSEVRSKAGDGGRGGKAGRTWQDPITDYWMGGGGGGSYSAGGGGGYGEYSSDPRGGGEGAFVSGEVGDGGDSSLRMEIVMPTIHRQNNITTSRGEGGLCWRSTAAGSTGGEGSGRFTRDGRAHTYVPRCRTELLTPVDGYESNDLPRFNWIPLYPSTTNGKVAGYSIEVAYEPEFNRPFYSTIVENATINFNDLNKGKLYWRVTPLYSRPQYRAGIPSEPFVYIHLNSPPQVDEVPQVNITVRIPKTVDLYPYVRDLDDPIEDLVITYLSGDILWRSGFIVTFLYDAYEPPHDVLFNVTDGIASTNGRIPVRILDDNHDPVLLGLRDLDPPRDLNSPIHIGMNEGEIDTYKVRYYDRDGDEVTLHLITDWDGISQGKNDTIVIKAEFGAVGMYEPYIVARDDRGGRSQMTLQIKVGNVGEPPEPPVFRHPREGNRYNEGDTVLFTIGIEDPDLVFDIPVHLTVISNVSGVLITQEVLDDLTFTTSELGPGHHRITAIVKDGEFTERSEMTLVVIGEPDKTQVWDPPDELWLVLGLLAFSLTLLVVSYLIGFRRRRARRRPM